MKKEVMKMWNEGNNYKEFKCGGVREVESKYDEIKKIVKELELGEVCSIGYDKNKLVVFVMVVN